MTLRYKTLVGPVNRAVEVSDAKLHLRVTDSASIATQANLAIGSGNAQLLIVSKAAGTIGNQYTARVVVSGNNTALSVSVSGAALTINCATSAGGASVSTVNDVIAKIYATPEAAALFDATDGAGDGTGTLLAASVASLSGGVDAGDEDSYIGLLIDAVTEILETYTQRAFINRTMRVYFDRWPSHCEGETLPTIEIPIAPVSAVSAVKHWNDVTEEYDTLDADLYDADFEDQDLFPRIVMKLGESFPYVIAKPNAIYVDITAGYGATHASVPKKIKSAILFLVSHFYMNREPVVTGTAVLANKVPYTFRYVMGTFKIPSV